MKKEFKALAMKCNQDQFDRIKPKLEKNNVIIHLTSSFERCDYLTNNLGGSNRVSVTNIVKEDTKNHDRTTHETWNEEIFLKNCGIETELELETFTVNRTGKADLYVDGIKYVPENKESYTITKEHILKYDMREEFPEVFEAKLVAGKWYKGTNGTLFVFKEKDSSFYKGCGFTNDYSWHDEFREYIYTEIREATHEEVFEALKSESVMRGYEAGVYVNSALNKAEFKLNNQPFDTDEDGLRLGGVCIFNKDGIWASIIKPKQMTQSDIEKELGYLIEII